MTKKKFLRLENSPLPPYFSNGRPLAEVQTNAAYIHATHA